MTDKDKKVVRESPSTIGDAAADLSFDPRAFGRIGSPRHYTAADFVPVTTNDLMRLMQAIGGGLAMEAMERFHRESGLSMQQLAKLTRIPPRTLARRREEGRLTPEESDRLVTVARVVAAAANLFGGDVEAGVEWLSKPLAALGGTIPLEIAETEAGSHAIETVILQLEHGVFP